MTPERAIKILDDPAIQVTAETHRDRYGNAWIIIARLGDYERELCSFASRDPFSAAQWLSRFDTLRKDS